MEGLKFYRCNECGNLFLTLVDPSVVPSCCGEEMVKLEASDSGSGEESHVPIVEVNGNKVLVKVGKHTHPMAAEHRIEWVAVTDGRRIDIQKLELTTTPMIDFTIRGNNTDIKAYSFCNIHGLWSSK